MSQSSSSLKRTNQALLVLVPLAVATGLFANTIGVDWLIDPATIHGVVALAIALLTPWKAPIVQRGLGMKRKSRWNSLALLALIAITLGSGLLHTTGLTDRIGPLTLMQVHIGAATIALLLIVFHYRSHRVPVRKPDLNRRSFLRLATLGSAAAATWIVWEGVLDVAGAEGADRRFTGSHERGSFNPAAMPVTSWLNDRVPRIDGEEWTIALDDGELSLVDVKARPQEELTAVLDCTSAWYSEQVWTGVRLDRLITTQKRSIEVVSATGYARRFPAGDLDKLWLVTDVGGEPISAGHGFPARIVAPDRRGFWWVKWVTEIRSSDVPSWLQLPFPIT